MINNKLSTSAFSFEVKVEVTGFKVTVTQEKTGKTKEFFTVHGNRLSLVKHMNSLTDDQLKMWFSSRE